MARLNLLTAVIERDSLRLGKKFDQPCSTKAIQEWSRKNGVDESDMLLPIEEFSTLNEFFTRRLRVSARPISEPSNRAHATLPCDCRLHVFPSVTEATTLWIKGYSFNLQTLLLDRARANKLKGGSIALCRLAPMDYHRFHSPISGTVEDVSLVNSRDLFSVKGNLIRNPFLDVLTRNKREIIWLRNESFGLVAMVVVGASHVGSISISVTPGDTVQKGDEVGVFAYGGSTVVLVFEKGRMFFDDDLIAASRKRIETLVRMGQSLGFR